MNTTSHWHVSGGHARNTSTGHEIELAHKGLLRDLPDDAMPSRPRGDPKERTFNLLIRDGIAERGNLWEEQLIGTSEGAANGEFANDGSIAPELRSVFGAILDDHYVIEGRSVRFLFPFQSFLPGEYKFHGRYKMFNGKILAFLSQPSLNGPGFNAGLIQKFYDVFNDEQDLTLLDHRVLALAKETSRMDHPREARQEVLLSRYYQDGDNDVVPPGALLPGAHRRFQEDLETVLNVKRLHRRDKVNAAVNVFYVHLALYFQRLAWLLEQELAAVLAALRDRTVPLGPAEQCFEASWRDSPFACTLRFRVSTGRSQPVRMSDPVVTSYAEQNRRQLLLPANLSVLGSAREVMSACIGADASRWTFTDMAASCRRDADLSDAFSEGLSLMASATVADVPEFRDDIDRQINAGASGLETLREALLKVGRSALRRHGRDIVQFLVHRGGRGYISSRGRSIFLFELGQDLLLLLAKVIVKDRQMPFREFLAELEAYGFRPQSRGEQDRLADTLRALNLLEKHSDAGEAMYVKHFL